MKNCFEPSFKNLTFCPLDIEISTELIQQMKSEVINLPRFYSQYRTCDMIPLFTPGGETERAKIMTSTEELQWTPLAESSPTLVGILEDKFFPIIDPLPRILILYSNPNGEVKIHIDCGRKNLYSLQHKLRIVLSGSVTGLWFLTPEGNRKHISSQNPVYILNGSHPHGMINESQEPKLTVCLGSPWTGNGSAKYRELLERSMIKFKEDLLVLNPTQEKMHFDFFQEDYEAALGHDPRPLALEIPKNP